MKRNILIPTDFSSSSLNTLKVFFEKYADKDIKYNIVFTSGYHLSNSITDLLFVSKTKIVQSAMEAEFMEAFNIIRNKFESQFASTQFDIFTGFSQDSFEAYLESYAIDEIYMSNNLKYNRKGNKNCFDLSKYVAKSKLEAVVIEQNYETQTNFLLQNSMQVVLEASPVHS